MAGRTSPFLPGPYTFLAYRRVCRGRRGARCCLCRPAPKQAGRHFFFSAHAHIDGHDRRGAPDHGGHDRSASTCSAPAGLHLGLLRRAGSRLPEFPVSAPTRLAHGADRGSWVAESTSTATLANMAAAIGGWTGTRRISKFARCRNNLGTAAHEKQ